MKLEACAHSSFWRSSLDEMSSADVGRRRMSEITPQMEELVPQLRRE